MSSITSPSAPLAFPGSVFALVDGDGGDLGCGAAECLEVRGEVGGAVAAAELDETDGLAGGGAVGGQTVEFADLNGGVGGVDGVGDDAACGVGGGTLCGGGGLGFCDAEMGRGLRAVVEAEDGFDRADELGGDADGALADAVGGVADLVVGELDAESGFDGGLGAGELEIAEFGRGEFGGETEFFGEGLDKLEGGGIGTVLGTELRARQLLLAKGGGVDGGLAANDDGDGDERAGGLGGRGGGVDEGSSFTAGESDAFLRGEDGDGFAGGHARSPWCVDASVGEGEPGLIGCWKDQVGSP